MDEERQASEQAKLFADGPAHPNARPRRGNNRDGAQ
jgi:hypothetical protein